METVTIDKDVYDELVNDQRFLECLRSNGVDNWDWYDEACKEYQELYGDDNG